MKIAHVVSTSPPYEGGMGTVALSLARELVKNPTYEVDVVTLKESFKSQITNSKFQINSNDQNPKIIKLHPWIRWGKTGLVPQLLWRLRKYDVVHLHYAFFGAVEMILFARLFGLWKGKFVLQYHNDVIGYGIVRVISWLDEMVFFKWMLLSAHRIIALSDAHYRNSRLYHYRRIVEPKLTFLPNGVDTEVFRHLKNGYKQLNLSSSTLIEDPETKNKQPKDLNSVGVPVSLLDSRFRGNDDDGRGNDGGKSRFVIMFVGALDRAHYFKGVDDLIDAFQIVTARQRAVVPAPHAKTYHLMIVGGGDMEEQYRKRAEQKLSKGSYTFAGRVPNSEIPKYLSFCDVFVLPSYEVESFGIVLIEALAMGKPVIASDLPSLDEVVRDDTVGLRFKRRDVSDLAEKILEISERNCSEMGQVGREYVLQNYAWDKIGKRLEKIYQSIMPNY